MSDALELQLRLRRLQANDALTDEQLATVEEMRDRIDRTYDAALAAAAVADEEWAETIDWLVRDEEG